MTILELIKLMKIDFTRGLVEYDGATIDGYTILDCQFEITPKNFLNYSKQDFRAKDKRGNINALTNAKRAIDCQMDQIFFSIGLNPKDFPTAVTEFILKSKDSPATNKDLPVKLKFLQAMRFAPAEIIAKARLLRNKLEHYYKEPSDEEVSNAMELAELFISATDNKLKIVGAFSITDKDKYQKYSLWDSIYVKYDYNKRVFNLRGNIGKKEIKIRVKNTMIEFYCLLKIATSFDYEEDVQDAVVELIGLIGHPIPKNNIKITI